MSNTHEFYVTLGTTDVVEDEATAAQLLQFLLKDASNRHEHIKYATVQHSELSEAEGDRLLQILDRFLEEDIESAIRSMDGLKDESE